jgi:hypothetical protein
VQLNKSSLRKIFLLSLPIAMFGAIAGTGLVQSQDARIADVSHDLVNKINFGLFNWKRDSSGNMIASFVMSNYGDRNIREITIGCDYTVNTANTPHKIERTLKEDDLATRLAGENLMYARTGRHYTDINFGPIDQANSIRYMTCQISGAKF